MPLNGRWRQYGGETVLRQTTRILIADDARSMRSLIRSAFPYAHRRLEFHEVSDGEQAVAAYRERRFDIAILDVLMPGLNGLEVLETIRRYDEDAFAVLISGAADSSMERNAAALGARDFVRKPVTHKMALEILHAFDTERRPTSVLVVDRSDIAPVTLKFGLNTLRLPHRMYRAESAQEALHAASRVHFDAVFIDTHLPGTGGLHTLAQIKRLRPNIYAVMFSEDRTAGAVTRARAHGADDYLLKSIDLERLRKMWSRMLVGVHGR